MEYENFTLELEPGGIAVFTANRQEKLNAMTDRSWMEVNAFFTWADSAREVRAIILTGAGEKAFIAGADLNVLVQKGAVDCLGGAGQKALEKIERCSKPVIAAVNGLAFGGGCEVALACDFRIAAEEAIFALPETGLGVLPGAGGTQRLTRLIGLGRAKDVILLGRKIGGAEAAQIGLATKCVPRSALLEEARRMAEKLMEKGPVATRIAKLVVQSSLSTGQEVGMLLEMLALSALCATEDKREGVTAFLEKRSPDFQGR